MMDAVNKSYRFPPTRQQKANYASLLPEPSKEGKKARSLETLLQRMEENSCQTGEENGYPIHLPSINSPLDTEYGEEEEDNRLPWPARLQGPLLHKIAVLRRALYLTGKGTKQAGAGMCALVESARESPSCTAKVLSRRMPTSHKLEVAVATSAVMCANIRCGARALPFSRYCLAHICSDTDQVLYSSCVASESAHTTCGDTVYDFLLNQPLCKKHITKAALECPVQQKKKLMTTKTRAKTLRTKKAKITPSIKQVTSSQPVPAKPSSSSATAPPLPSLSSSSWSSGDSDGENPVISAPKRKRTTQPQHKENRLPSLTPDAAPISLPLPMPILPPPLPDIGKFMDDSSSEEDT